MVFQSLMTALPASLRSSGARICPTLSGLVVVSSIMPMVSPVSSSVCALGIGMTTKALS